MKLGTKKLERPRNWTPRNLGPRNWICVGLTLVLGWTPTFLTLDLALDLGFETTLELGTGLGSCLTLDLGLLDLVSGTSWPQELVLDLGVVGDVGVGWVVAGVTSGTGTGPRCSRRCWSWLSCCLFDLSKLNDRMGRLCPIYMPTLSTSSDLQKSRQIAFGSDSQTLE